MKLVTSIWAKLLNAHVVLLYFSTDGDKTPSLRDEWGTKHRVLRIIAFVTNSIADWW